VQRPSKQLADLRELEWLAEVIERIVAQRLGGGVERAVGGHHDHRDGAIESANLLQCSEPVEARHADVEEHRVGACRAHEIDRIAAVRRDECLVAFRGEHGGERLADGRFVVGYQDACHGRSLAAGVACGACRQTRSRPARRQGLAAVQLEPSAVLGDDLAADAQAEP